MAMSGPEVLQGLIARGYSPVHAAALAGHILQESGGDPTNINKGEDAHGLVQWRLDRWGNLQNFAKAQGKEPTDPNVQLDFIGHEMAGPESKAGQAFLAAKDLPSASAALKGYIRFGDDSDARRLGNAQSLMGGQAGMLTPTFAGSRAGLPAATAGAAAMPSSAQPAAPEDNSLMQSLQGVQKMLQQPDLPMPDLNAAPQIARARQIAAAIQARQLTESQT